MLKLSKSKNIKNRGVISRHKIYSRWHKQIKQRFGARRALGRLGSLTYELRLFRTEKYEKLVGDNNLTIKMVNHKNKQWQNYNKWGNQATVK